ncbi:MAG: RNA recognition motif domain-containing protein [Candidatus Binatia bacterium]
MPILGVHKVYVGSLPLSSTGQEMKRLFDAYGTVESALVIKGKISGRSRGFGFVEMSMSQETVIAITELNGTELGGRALQVSEARPRILTP